MPRQTDVRPHPHIGLVHHHVSVRGRDRASGQRRLSPDHPPGRSELDDGRQRHQSFGALRHHARARRALHGIQAWVALPEADEEIAPASCTSTRAICRRSSSTASRIKVIAGAAFGMSEPGAARIRRCSMRIWTCGAGASSDVVRDYTERAVYVAQGSVSGRRPDVRGRPDAGVRRGDACAITAVEPSTVMLLGGEPVGPRHIWWNFVSSRKERIEQAKADWRARSHSRCRWATITNSFRCRKIRRRRRSRCRWADVRRISKAFLPRNQRADRQLRPPMSRNRSSNAGRRARSDRHARKHIAAQLLNSSQSPGHRARDRDQRYRGPGRGKALQIRGGIQRFVAHPGDELAAVMGRECSYVLRRGDDRRGERDLHAAEIGASSTSGRERIEYTQLQYAAHAPRQRAARIRGGVAAEDEVERLHVPDRFDDVRRVELRPCERRR